MINQRGLEALRAFVESGSVARAAEQMGRTHPQVGRLLSALEDELGLQLFERKSRPLVLTREGWEFYKRAEPILVAHEGLSRFAAQMRVGGSGRHLRILTSPFTAQAIVGDAVSALAEKYDNFTAALDSRVHLDIEEWIADAIFDICVMVLPLNHSAFEVEEFLSVESMIAMPADHPLSARDVIELDDLTRTDVIVMHPRSILRQHLEQLCRSTGKTLRTRFEAANGLIACQLVGCGLGCSLSDPFVASSSGTSNLVLRRFRPAFTLRYGFAFPLWQNRSPIVNELKDKIAELAHQKWKAILEKSRGTLSENAADPAHREASS